ncbi:MAG: hypothetical protein AAFV53_09810 [Myxococcota bacterium]
MSSVLFTGCQSDTCDQLCTQTSDAIRDCLSEWPSTWDDLDATNYSTFRSSCRTRWSRVQADLESREIEDALEQCDETLSALNTMQADETVCDQLRAIYIE